MELKEGQRLRVKKFKNIPDYWNVEMKKWMGRIVTFKGYTNYSNIKIYEDRNWLWAESDFQIVFDTWEDVKKAIREECNKYTLCKNCPLYNECYCDNKHFEDKNYKQLAENFEKMFGMECYVLKNERTKKEFNLSDLKDEMIVETRNNNRYLVFGKMFLSLNGFMIMENYSNDFKYTYGDKSFDIIAVYPKYGHYGYGLNGMLNYVEEPIWKEEKEQVTKDVSLEEINALLKEKYPDVEKFNLPIDK